MNSNRPKSSGVSGETKFKIPYSNNMMGISASPNGFLADSMSEPCRVCGEPSSGYHCGSVTCEACKKFFLRSINGEHKKYKCLRNQDCVIMRTTRTQCQYCRYKKCQEVGMTNNPENPNSPTVAELFKTVACWVCSASSSGVHFGAITCEGCKGFFRRSIKERAPERYKCMEQGKCGISAQTRNMCRFCRYQACLRAGMSSKKMPIQEDSNVPDSLADALKSLGVKCHVSLVPDLEENGKLANESEVASFVNKCVKSFDVELVQKDRRIASLEQETARLTARIAELEAGKQSGSAVGAQSKSHCAGEEAKPESYTKRLRSSRKAINYRN